MLKLIAFDLDGTLTQHKTPISDTNLNILKVLSKNYKLLMLGAGMCRRIFTQLREFPIDIIGNYGLQYAKYNSEKKDIEIVFDNVLPCNRESIEARVTALRQKYGYENFIGDNVEYHSSGCVTIPLLGTKADLADKLAFDPDRLKRRVIYDDVKTIFSEYTVFIGGSSSFDMAPHPFDKAYALSKYCLENNISHNEVCFIGDDYGRGGNDEAIFLADFNSLKIDSYLDFPEVVKGLDAFN